MQNLSLDQAANSNGTAPVQASTNGANETDSPTHKEPLNLIANGTGTNISSVLGSGSLGTGGLESIGNSHLQQSNISTSPASIYLTAMETLFSKSANSPAVEVDATHDKSNLSSEKEGGKVAEHRDPGETEANIATNRASGSDEQVTNNLDTEARLLNDTPVRSLSSNFLIDDVFAAWSTESSRTWTPDLARPRLIADRRCRPLLIGLRLTTSQWGSL